MAEILVVEDYPPLVSALTRLLRSRGHRVACSFNVKSVIDSANAYECAVLDIDLPDGNGVSLAEQLLNQRRVGCIVFFTATHERDILAQANKLGLVVNKSEGTHRLLKVIDELKQTTRGRHERLVPKVEVRPLVS